MKVQVIKRVGQATAVTWVDGGEYKAGVIPQSALDEGGEVPMELLNAAIPYGEMWETIGNAPNFPQRLAHEFRKLGIWTESDLFAKSMHINGAILRAIGSMNVKTISQNLQTFKEVAHE